MDRKGIFVLLVAVLLCINSLAYAQSTELAATLEVLAAGVEVRRVNTGNWIPVSVEAIVGVGDVIRTDATGSARITFFADGTDTELLPNTEYEIIQFEGDDQTFNITVEVLVGQTVQRLGQILDANSSYDVNTPGMALAARGTEFAIRVETTGRSGMLVFDGMVDAAAEADTADVPPGFGIRAASNGPLSDVVQATTFDELDAALDGCAVSVAVVDDVRLNVRLGPSLEFDRVGTVAPAELTVFVGVNESGGWYRIDFNGGFGWVLSSSATIEEGCAGLRVFPDAHFEDASLYESIGDPIDMEDIDLPEAESTAEPGN